jgi:8-oxo-dGTP diphosphatase
LITVTAAILVKDSTVCIAKRKASGQLPGKWEFPGGKIEENETPEACLKRELREELDIKAAVGDFMDESTYQYDFGVVRVLFYRVFWDDTPLVSKDHQEVRWVPLHELKGYDFAPADIAFVEKLIGGQIPI